jgi:hypothetical protein
MSNVTNKLSNWDEIKTESSFIPKSLHPGNVIANLRQISLEPSFKEGTYDLILLLEGQPETDPSFEGWFIDKDNESLGRFKGRSSRVKYSAFAFEDKVSEGREYFVTTSTQKALRTLGKALGKEDQVISLQAGTIADLIREFNRVILKDQNNWLYWLLCGTQTVNQNGHEVYYLHLPSWKQSAVAFEPVTANPRKVADYLPTHPLDKNKSHLYVKVPAGTAAANDPNASVAQAAAPAPAFRQAVAAAASQVGTAPHPQFPQPAAAPQSSGNMLYPQQDSAPEPVGGWTPAPDFELL